jgi:carboxymethylenebutenolidase
LVFAWAASLPTWLASLLHFAEKAPHVPASTVAAIRMGTWENVTIHAYPGTEHGFNRYGYPRYHGAAAGVARERTSAHFRGLLS